MVEFRHVPETFTSVSTAVFSLMVQVKVTFVPLYVGCIVVMSMVGAGTVEKKRRRLIMKVSRFVNMQTIFGVSY